MLLPFHRVIVLLFLHVEGQVVCVAGVGCPRERRYCHFFLQEAVVHTHVQNDVQFFVFWAFPAGTRTPPYLDVSFPGVRDNVA